MNGRKPRRPLGQTPGPFDSLRGRIIETLMSRELVECGKFGRDYAKAEADAVLALLNGPEGRAVMEAARDAEQEQWWRALALVLLSENRHVKIPPRILEVFDHNQYAIKTWRDHDFVTHVVLVDSAGDPGVIESPCPDYLAVAAAFGVTDTPRKEQA